MGKYNNFQSKVFLVWDFISKSLLQIILHENRGPLKYPSRDKLCQESVKGLDPTPCTRKYGGTLLSDLSPTTTYFLPEQDRREGRRLPDLESKDDTLNLVTETPKTRSTEVREESISNDLNR